MEHLNRCSTFTLGLFFALLLKNLTMISTILIILAVVYFLKNLLVDVKVSNPLENSGEGDPTIVSGKFTPKLLVKYNGSDDPKIFMAVKGNVYDVTNGAAFYGPGGPYENFAGRDASRGLALNSFDPSVLTPLDQPLDTLNNLSASEKESLESWEEHFENKYRLVGTLHNETELEATSEPTKEKSS